MRAQVEPGTELESVESETADLEEVSLEDPPPAKRPGLATQAMQRMQRKAAPVHSSTKQSPSGAANLLGSGLARSEMAPAADEESARGGEVGGDLRRSFLSSVTFGYFQEVMSTGRRRALETGDLPPLPDDDRAQDIAVQFKRHYARSRRVDAALVATIGRPYLMAALFKLPHDCIVFLTPMLLKALIHLLEADEPNLAEGMLIVGAILATGVLQSLCLQQYFHRVYRVSYRVMAALNVAIYDKSLVITNTARASTTPRPCQQSLANHPNPRPQPALTLTPTPACTLA